MLNSASIHIGVFMQFLHSARTPPGIFTTSTGNQTPLKESTTRQRTVHWRSSVTKSLYRCLPERSSMLTSGQTYFTELEPGLRDLSLNTTMDFPCGILNTQNGMR